MLCKVHRTPCLLLPAHGEHWLWPVGLRSSSKHFTAHWLHCTLVVVLCHVSAQLHTDPYSVHVYTLSCMFGWWRWERVLSMCSAVVSFVVPVRLSSSHSVPCLVGVLSRTQSDTWCANSWQRCSIASTISAPPTGTCWTSYLRIAPIWAVKVS